MDASIRMCFGKDCILIGISIGISICIDLDISKGVYCSIGSSIGTRTMLTLFPASVFLVFKVLISKSKMEHQSQPLETN